MRTRTTLAFLMAAGLAASTATAQDTEAISGGISAQRSPSTTPTDTPPVTNRGVVGNEIPGARGVPRTTVPGALSPGGVAPGGAMQARPGGYFVPANATFDQLFAAAASSAGLSEVAMARIAAQRAGSDEVRLFAQRMIGDHTKANQELMALAGQKGIALPNTLPVSAQAELDSLGGLSGEDFDKCYIHNQLAGHIQAVGLFEAESERGQDTAMKSWAAKTLPTLKEHKMMVKRMHEACEAKEKSASSTTAH